MQEASVWQKVLNRASGQFVHAFEQSKGGKHDYTTPAGLACDTGNCHATPDKAMPLGGIRQERQAAWHGLSTWVEASGIAPSNLVGGALLSVRTFGHHFCSCGTGQIGSILLQAALGHT